MAGTRQLRGHYGPLQFVGHLRGPVRPANETRATVPTSAGSRSGRQQRQWICPEAYGVAGVDLVSAIVCDYAAVRDNLLTIVGGGISQLHRPVFPARLEAMVAMQLSSKGDAVSEAHRISVQLSSVEDAEPLAAVEGTFNIGGTSLHTAAIGSLVADLRAALVPAAGEYLITIELDGVEARRFEMSAMKAKKPRKPRASKAPKEDSVLTAQ